MVVANFRTGVTHPNSQASGDDLDLVLVEWDDPALHTGSHSREDVPRLEVAKRKTVGWLIQGANGVIQIVSEMSDDRYTMVTTVPESLITGTTKLSKRRAKPPQ